jgi:hypothetical protein
MRIAEKRAREVFAPMLEQYMARGSPFLTVDADRPQAYVPASLKSNPALWARFLFYLCLYMRGGYDSVEAAKRLAQAFLNHPELFDERVLGWSEADIQRVMGGFIPIFRERIGRFWLHNSQVLWQYWSGDPRRIFVHARSADESYFRLMGSRYRPLSKRLQAATRGQLPALTAGSIHDLAVYEGFLGFREKMTSMLAYFLFDASLMTQLPPLSAPVDFHHVRIYLQTGMLPVVTGSVYRYEQLVAPGIAVAEYLQRTFSLPMPVYGDIIWLWSKNLCSLAPHNWSRKVQSPTGRVIRESVVPTWSKAERRAYERSCGQCAIARWCTKAVSSGPYYTDGRFVLGSRGAPKHVQPLLHNTMFASRRAQPPAGSSS